MRSVNTPHASTSDQCPSVSTSSSHAWLHIAYCVGTIFHRSAGQHAIDRLEHVCRRLPRVEPIAIVEPQHLCLVERLEVHRVNLAQAVGLS
jgi:hypothetical protein